MKVIFLNIDNITLSSNLTNKPFIDRIVQYNFCKTLRRIIKKTDAKFVLTAFNKSNIAKLYFKTTFKKYGINVYDCTQNIGMEKGIDIQEWLNHHLDVENIAILDDNNDMCHLSEYLVKMNMKKSKFLWLFQSLNNKFVKQCTLTLNKPFDNKMKNQVKGNVRKLF